jgi:ribose transport system substrate-binding protein
MRTRRVLAALAATTLAVTLGACGADDGGAGDDGGGGDEERYVAIISKGFQHEFWQAVKEGAEQEADKQGVRITFDGPASETEVEAQMTMLSNALTKDPDAIGFAALTARRPLPCWTRPRGGDPGDRVRLGRRERHSPHHGRHRQSRGLAEAAKQMAELIGHKGKVG